MLARRASLSFALLMLMPFAPGALAQDEPPAAEEPAPITPADAIRGYLASQVDAHKPTPERAQGALELYWALLWGERQDVLQQAAIARAEQALAEARAQAGARPQGTEGPPQPGLLALEAWAASARSARASTRAQSGSSVYQLFLGSGSLAVDAFPLKDLPQPMKQYEQALGAADAAVEAARAYYDSLQGAVELTTPAGAQLWVEAGERLAEQELAREGMRLMARRAYDNWLKNQGRLRQHYGVEAGPAVDEQEPPGDAPGD